MNTEEKVERRNGSGKGEVVRVGAWKPWSVSNCTFVLICSFVLNSVSAWASDGCVDVTLGSVQLSVPRQHMTPTTPHKDNSGNFIFEFDSTVPGVECLVGCKELFVNISTTSSTPVQQWKNLEPKFAERKSGNYRVYLTRYDQGSSKPLREILVPADVISPQDEFYSCLPEGRVSNPGCTSTIVAKSGLVAEFSIPRKVLSKAREAAHFLTQSIDQFAENHAKGICK